MEGGPGQQNFLMLYEMASLDIPNSKGGQELYRGPEFTERTQNVRSESYWLDFVMYTPVTRGRDFPSL